MSQMRFFTTPLASAASSARQDVMNLLTEFCNEVENVTQNRLTCALVPGFTTGLGQEYRATVRSTAKGMDHILFRAYVPGNGVPLRLDFYEDEMRVCNSVADAGAALADFAGRDATRETLRLLSQ